jgi:hypothetical protein
MLRGGEGNRSLARSFIRSLVRSEREEGRRSNVNDDGKKVMMRGRRSNEKDWWGKVILIEIFNLRCAQVKTYEGEMAHNADKISSLG